MIVALIALLIVTALMLISYWLRAKSAYLRMIRLHIGLYLTILISLAVTGCSIISCKPRADVDYGPPEYIDDDMTRVRPDSLNGQTNQDNPEGHIGVDVVYGPPPSFR